MNLLRKFLFIILCLLFCVSCKISKSTTSSMVSLERLFDQNWHNILENSKVKMRDEWLAKCDPINNFTEQKYGSDYHYLASEEEIKKCEIIPIEHFKMDSQWSMKLSVDKSFPIGDLISLKTDFADFYAIKDDAFLYFVSMKYKDNQWVWSSYGPLDKKLSDAISLLYFKKKIKVYCLDVANVSTNYLFYVENGQFMNLNYGGLCTPLKDVLLKLV